LLAASRALAYAHLNSGEYALTKQLSRLGFARGAREAG
jgi:hypothetical protein